MNESLIPIAVVYAWVETGSGQHTLHFNCRRGEVVVTDYIQEFLDVLRLCTGVNTLTAIKEELGHIDGDVVDAILGFSLRKGIVLDSRQQYQAFHDASSNPSLYLNPLNPDQVARLQARPRIKRRPGEIYTLPRRSFATDLALVARARESTRVFAQAPLSLTELSGFLASLYGTGELKLTPSAGALYPIDIYLVLFTQTEDLRPGIYQVIPETMQIVRISADAYLDTFSHALETSELLNGYNAIIFLSANMQRVATKYSNRAYRYALIEAGHVAQNAYLHAAEAGLGVLEYGGYNDNVVASLLGVRPDARPILSTIVFGKKARGNSRQPELSLAALAYTLEKGLIKQHKIIQEPSFNRFVLRDRVVPRVYATAGINKNPMLKVEEEHLSACGDGHSIEEAKVKVLAEAYERYASGRTRVDHVAAASSLDGQYLDPRRAFPLRHGEFSNADLVAFDPAEKIQWTRGYRLLSGEETLLPVETVYYPLCKHDLRRPLCYRSNSSGVAAHVDKDTAVLNAVLELVERDALMVLWYARRQVGEIEFQDMPAEIAGKVTLFQKSGVRVRFFDLTLDTVPVVLCALEDSNRKSAFFAGASAAFAFPRAATKAFNEAAFMLLSWRRMRRRPISPSKVVFPQDHGTLYYTGEQNAELAWLLNTPISTAPTPTKISKSSLFKKIDPYLVDIAKPTASIPLWVVRAVSENLLPINFGYGSEHTGHGRLESLGLKWARDYPSFPHFFA